MISSTRAGWDDAIDLVEVLQSGVVYVEIALRGESDVAGFADVLPCSPVFQTHLPGSCFLLYWVASRCIQASLGLLTFKVGFSEVVVGLLLVFKLPLDKRGVPHNEFVGSEALGTALSEAFEYSSM